MQAFHHYGKRVGWLVAEVIHSKTTFVRYGTSAASLGLGLGLRAGSPPRDLPILAGGTRLDHMLAI
jgi:hypothetical protein